MKCRQSLASLGIVLAFTTGCYREQASQAIREQEESKPITKPAATWPLYFLDDEIGDPSLQRQDTALFLESDEIYVSQSVPDEARRWSGMFENCRVNFQFVRVGEKLGPPVGVFTHPLGSSRNPACLLASVNTVSTAKWGLTPEYNFGPGDATCPEIGVLDLFGASVDNALEKLVARCRGLRVLSLPFSGTEFKGRPLPLPDSLEKLVVYNSTLDAAFFASIGRLPKLKMLVLWGCSLQYPSPFSPEPRGTFKPQAIPKPDLVVAPASLQKLVILNCSVPIMQWVVKSKPHNLEEFIAGAGWNAYKQCTLQWGAGEYPRLKKVTVYESPAGTKPIATKSFKQGLPKDVVRLSGNPAAQGSYIVVGLDD